MLAVVEGVLPQLEQLEVYPRALLGRTDPGRQLRRRQIPGFLRRRWWVEAGSEAEGVVIDFVAVAVVLVLDVKAVELVLANLLLNKKRVFDVFLHQKIAENFIF